MSKTKKYRYTCDRCGGHDVAQEALIDLNTGCINFADTIWCRDCEQDVSLVEDATVKPIYTEKLQIS